MRSRSLAALGLTSVALLSCDTPTQPEAPVALSVESTEIVRIVLEDIDTRAAGALEDAGARSRFADAVARLNRNMTVGRLDRAASDLRDAHAALDGAARLDTDGSGDADRAAILLALQVANTEITNARHNAAGGVQ